MTKFNDIQSRIFEIQGMQVMLDRDLAELYKTETRTLKQAVKRNIERFPKDFMFELNSEDIKTLVSQSVIPSKSYFGGAKPYAFTEQGVDPAIVYLNSNTQGISIAETPNYELIQICKDKMEEYGKEHCGDL